MIKRAIEFAVKAHQQQLRKGTDIPYITHPFNVGVMLSRGGCSEEIIIAGILHDTVEDGDEISLDDIRREFGDHVSEIVAGCSEPDKSLPWRERKEHTLEYLKSAPEDVLLVVAADKLDNIRSIADDYARHGDGLWARFNAGKEEQRWYYHGIASSLSQSCIADTGLVQQFDASVREVFPLPSNR